MPAGRASRQLGADATRAVFRRIPTGARSISAARRVPTSAAYGSDVEVVEQIGMVQVVNVVAEQMQKIGPPQTQLGTVWQTSPLLPHDPTEQTGPLPQLAVELVLELVVVDVEVEVGGVSCASRSAMNWSTMASTPSASPVVMQPPRASAAAKARRKRSSAFAMQFGSSEAPLWSAFR
jgi:hypothetical protein